MLNTFCAMCVHSLISRLEKSNVRMRLDLSNHPITIQFNVISALNHMGNTYASVTSDDTTSLPSMTVQVQYGLRKHAAQVTTLADIQSMPECILNMPPFHPESQVTRTLDLVCAGMRFICTLSCTSPLGCMLLGVRRIPACVYILLRQT